MDFKSHLKQKSKYIEDKLKEYMPQESGYQKNLFKSMNYSLSSGGKRLRPILIMESYRLCGGSDEKFVPFSMAIEMIHTYSLIHDDLPALDNDELRRGKKTNHIVFGEDMAILAGDGLLSHAFEIMLGSETKSLEEAQNKLKAAYEISRGAGIYGMIAGQVVDVESEGKSIDIDKLNFIHLNKTAAMIRACMRCGARLAGAPEREVEAISLYGEKIGLAFQIVDDILDIEGDENILGKHVGSDIENEKSTYPKLIGLEKSKEVSKRLVMEAKEALSIFENETEFLAKLSEYIVNRDR